MATNQEIWGESTNWDCPVSTMSGSNQDMKPLVGYFGEAPSRNYPAGCLFSGIYHDIFPTINGNMFTNAPIDDSISYCGLGNESVWSRVQYYMCGPATTGSLTASDNRSVTNFAFCHSNGTASGLFQNNNSDANQKRGNRDRWAPMGFNLKELNPTAANTNSNRGVVPYVQLPVRNMVLTATLRVARTLVEDRGSTNGMDLTNIPLWDYMDTSKQKNYTTHPYILGISIQPYMVATNGADNIDPVTGVPPTGITRSTINIYSGLTILSPLSYADGVESDAGNPGNVLNDVYSYYWSKTPSRLTGIWIFGASSVGMNDMDYIRQLQTDEVKGQLLWALPHPYATMRSMSQTNNYGWYYLEYYDNGGDDNLVHWIMEQMACFGLFFTIDKNTALTGALNDENMCLGVLENGIGHGKWVSGNENLEQPQWEWDTTNSSSYKPLPPGPEPFPPAPSEDDQYDWDGTGTSGINAYRHAYCLSQVEVNAVHGYISRFMDLPEYYRIWDTENPTPSSTGTEADTGIFLKYNSDYNKFVNKLMGTLESTFLNSDPNACIVDLILFPFNISSYVNLGNPEVIKMGNSELKNRSANENNGIQMYEVKGRTAPSNTIITIDLGTEVITPKYNDFRDYKPYTTCELTIPYHGTVVIDTADFMGATLGVELKVDLSTGLSTAFVTKNGAPRISIPGNIGIHVPLTAFNSGQYFSDISARGAAIANTKIDQVTGMVSGVQKMLSAGQNTISGIMGAAAGDSSNVNPLLALGPMGAPLVAGSAAVQSFAPVAKTTNTLKALEEQLEHIQVNPTQVTSFSSNLSSVEMKRCRLTYHRCIMNSNYNEANYGKTVGFATNKTGTVGQFTGYSKFSNAIITGTMTEEEKAMILDKLESGVIVNP